MSTLLEKAVRMIGGESAATKAYRESVFGGTIDEGILFDARRIAAEWQADRRTYVSRVAACESLKTELPRLQAAAAEAAKALADAERFASAVLLEGVTVGELRERILAASPKADVSTPSDIARGTLWLTDAMPSGHLGNLKSQLLSAKNAVDACRSRAEQLLRDTTAESCCPCSAQVAIGHRITEIQTRIASRAEVLESESRAVAVRAECEALARGDVPAFGQQRTPSGTLYQRARARLDSLYELMAGREDALKADQRDRDELGRLRARADEARAAALERLADPRNMRWCE